MTSDFLFQLKLVSEDANASASAKEAAKLLITTEEASIEYRRATRRLKAKTELENIFASEEPIWESDLIAAAKRAGVTVKQPVAEDKERVRLVRMHSDDVRHLLKGGWTIGRQHGGEFEMLAPEK